MILIHKRECVLTLLLGLLAGAAVADGRDDFYTVRVDEGLRTLEVTARFNAPVSRLTARSRWAPGYVERLETCGDDVDLVLSGRRIHARGGELTCVRYTVDLRAAARSERQNRTLAPENVLVPPSKWLWRASPRRARNVVVRFELADGVRVSTPWEALDDAATRFRIRQSPESANAPVAFGRFVETERDIPGATLRIAMLAGKRDSRTDAIIDWVTSAASNVTLAYGWFPNPEPHIVIVPLGGSGSPVPFGRVIRDGGESVELYVNERAPIDRFYRDWTATHEFSHFLLPYVTYRQRWISEGFAQYQQNVLLARAGQYTSQEAWQKIYEGFERGRRSRPELSPNRASRDRPSGSTMKVYWSGAVLALMADVELRRHSGGTQSLDTVLRDLGDCCLPSARTWSGTELFAKLDELAGDDVFMSLYRRYADADGFPDYGPVFAELGITVRRGRVILEDEAPMLAARDDITAKRSGMEAREPSREGLRW